MRLLVALCLAVFVYLAIGVACGTVPQRLTAARRRRRSAGFADWLHQAGITASPRQFVGASIGGGVLGFLAAYGLSGVGAIGMVSGVLVAGAPRVMYTRRASAARSQRLAAWPDALRDIITNLRSSLSVHRSLCELAQSGPEPLRPYFQRYQELSIALDHKAALEVVREQLADPLSDRIVEILLVAFDQGSAIVIQILEDLASSTADDLRLVEEVATAHLETRLESRGAAVLPLVVLALLCSATPGYQQFYATPGGWFVILVGTAVSAIGIVMVERLAQLPGEERILAAGEVKP